jgi:hypothetical protein
MRLAGSNNAYGTAIALQINRRDLSASRDGTFHGVACSVRPDNAVILIGPAGPAHFGADDRKKTVRAPLPFPTEQACFPGLADRRRCGAKRLDSQTLSLLNCPSNSMPAMRQIRILRF